MTKAEAKRQERAAARARLLEWIKPGDSIHCILRHRAASGMFRVIQLVKLDCNGRQLYLGWTAATAMDDRYDDDREGIAVSGAGMDMGFHLVYNLGRTLWPDGYRCSGARCHSNDHNNAPYPKRAGRMKHRDGGYALQSVWL